MAEAGLLPAGGHTPCLGPACRTSSPIAHSLNLILQTSILELRMCFFCKMRSDGKAALGAELRMALPSGLGAEGVAHRQPCAAGE